MIKYRRKIMTNNKSMITPKDLLYLSDAFDQMLVLNKRLASEKNSLETEEIINCFDNVITQLQKNYTTLLKIIEKEVK